MTRTGQPFATPLDIAKAMSSAPKKSLYYKAADRATIAVTTSTQEVMRATNVPQPKSGLALVMLSGFLQSYGTNLQCVWQVGLAQAGGSYISSSAQAVRMVDRQISAAQQIIDFASGTTGGTYTLTATKPGASGVTSAAISKSATPAAVASAIGAMSNIGGTGNVAVYGADGGPYRVSFLNSALDAVERPPVLTADGTNLTGTTPGITVSGSGSIAPRFLHSGWRTTYGVVDFALLGNAPGTQCDLIWQMNANINGAGQMDFSTAAGTGALMVVQPL